MTQAQLGAAVGVTQKTIDNWEHDRRYPKSAIGALEDVLGTGLDGGEQPPRIPAGLRRMVDALSDEEREALLAELTGQPAAPAPPAHRTDRETA